MVLRVCGRTSGVVRGGEPCVGVLPQVPSIRFRLQVACGGTGVGVGGGVVGWVRARKMEDACRCSVYLLYWYKSTNTDARYWGYKRRSRRRHSALRGAHVIGILHIRGAHVEGILKPIRGTQVAGGTRKVCAPQAISAECLLYERLV